ncbi:GCN5 family N-acetyltransferase [Sphaerisporangium melleum]|uniref:GCN5 family N-acetyltransferase n=1 Tax=Sphaerisporangium melleum TaxID=321316 RepID=A0A917R0T3_9ACTN|nr:GNAT family N-acetyltransferase [Sphaerisporangium melleum]GGK81969.1 GCN5 family N-acetyltransferase [Sphaerisporangium melleum]GII73778.1 GCN5 family N-acetyltransferase [Sphaerisporangium melleum]
MSLTVDQATPADASVISQLVQEIEIHYGSADILPDSEQVEMINRWLFGDKPAAWVLLARDHDRVVGMAAYSYHWPAAAAEASMFLKELFVREGDRRRGVANLLMQRLYDIARSEGCTRVEWQTETTNQDAQAFYASLGAKVHDGKVFYRVQV